MQPDVIIIGSGLGGLLCGNILAMEGMKVCVLEKNKQYGGNLQTFSRDKKIFDTGVHYIGGLDKGQNLCQVFKYLGLMDSLQLKKMDAAFDRIWISDDEKEYAQYQGWDAFVQQLTTQFPAESAALLQYREYVQDACSRFPLYNLTMEGDADAKHPVMIQSAREVIASLTMNETLQAVLAGNNLLYAGEASTTPFHVHALIVNSYIESSWKCVDGGSQIAKILVSNIRRLGGDIRRNTAVTRIGEEDGLITHVETEDGQKIRGKYFISNMAPDETLNLTSSRLLKQAYRQRVQGLAQGIGSFSLHIVLNEKSVPYQNHNYYYHKKGQLWEINNYNTDDWPRGYGLYFTPDRHDEKYAATISILTPMRFEEVAHWQGTYNRVGRESARGADYEAFKKKKAEQLLDIVEQRMPGLRQHIKSYYTSTPLTNRDYIGGTDGSMYGIKKDYHDPLKTTLSPRTKIPNLFLTGQNINLHGILGTSLSAVLTCCMLMGDNSLVDKIRNG